MLTAIQNKIVTLLSKNRYPSSYFAGGCFLNIDNPRISPDIDVFTDNVDINMFSYLNDYDTLVEAGFNVECVEDIYDHGLIELLVSNKDNKFTYIQYITGYIIGHENFFINSHQMMTEETKEFRFLPLVNEHGFKLHHVDLVTNKILALAERSKIMDYYDFCQMIANREPVEAYIWAAVAKDPGYTPFSLLESMSRHTKYRPEDFAQLKDSLTLDIRTCKELFQEAYHSCREKFSYAPIDLCGKLFYTRQNHSIFFPTEQDFIEENYLTHTGCVRGSLPDFLTIDTNDTTEDDYITPTR